MNITKLYNDLPLIPRQLIGAALIAVLAAGAAALLKLAMKRPLGKSSSRFPEKKRKTFVSLISNAVKWVIYFVALFKIFDIFRIPSGSLLAVASVGTVALGFGAQSVVADALTGLFIIMEDKLRIGDVVDIDGKAGAVEAVGLRTTSVCAANGGLHIIPNSKISVITNMSRGGADAGKVTVDFALGYDNDVDLAMAALENAAREVQRGASGLRGDLTVAGIVEMSEWGLKIRVTAECEKGAQGPVETALRREGLVRLRETGVRFPAVKY